MLRKYDNLRRLCNVELDVNRKILFVLKKDREKLLSRIKQMQGILRTPRLYSKYRERMEEAARKLEFGGPSAL